MSFFQIERVRLSEDYVAFCIFFFNMVYILNATLQLSLQKDEAIFCTLVMYVNDMYFGFVKVIKVILC